MYNFSVLFHKSFESELIHWNLSNKLFLTSWVLVCESVIWLVEMIEGMELFWSQYGVHHIASKNLSEKTSSVMVFSLTYSHNTMSLKSRYDYSDTPEQLFY